MADLLARLQSALTGRYTIERELGRGGTATVFLAREVKHDRAVALKVLHPEVALALGPERFLREIQVTAKLRHPNILPLLDSGEVDGLLYYVMPYADGGSLRQRLDREKQFPLDDALRLAREIAEALESAHSNGIVHRDIKPENILFETGHALVSDFGIARAITVAGGEKLTQTGIALGTPAYMSPEQAAGSSVVDGRSDLYSLACVVYEMLAGEPPYTGATAQAVIAKRFSEPVPHLRTLRDVPEAVEQVVTKALARAPADRFATAGQFARALSAPLVTAELAPAGRWSVRRALPLGLAGLALLLMGGLLSRTLSGGRNTGTAGSKRLAVLPFENVGRPEGEYFADGITDAVRGKLAMLPGLAVIARASSGEYKKITKPAPQIAQELGVEYLLTATVRWETGPGGARRVRVSPELVEVARGSVPSTKWGQPFDAALGDVFQVQTDIASRVAQALDVALSAGAQQQLAERPTRDLAAYEAFLRGQAAAKGGAAWDPSSVRRALPYYEQAVALDSNFALAWAQLSRAHGYVYASIIPTPADAEAARGAAERAVALAPNRPEGHLALSYYYAHVLGDVARALDQDAQAVRLAPSNDQALTDLAADEVKLGRWEAALSHLRRAERVDPRSARVPRGLGRALLRLRRYPEALQAYDHGLALAPADLTLREGKAMVFLAQGDLAKARAVLNTVPKEVEPTALVAYVATYFDLTWVLDDAQQTLLLRLTPSEFDGDRGGWGIVFAQTYALRGDRVRTHAYADSARSAFKEQLRATPRDPQRHVFLGLALAYLGRKPDAVREGERGVALLPITQDAYAGPYLQHQLARIHMLVGEPERALKDLEPLLKIPYYLSPEWLRIDPTFASLRGNPRFERLVATQ